MYSSGHFNVVAIYDMNIWKGYSCDKDQSTNGTFKYRIQLFERVIHNVTKIIGDLNFSSLSTLLFCNSTIETPGYWQFMRFDELMIGLGINGIKDCKFIYQNKSTVYVSNKYYNARKWNCAGSCFAGNFQIPGH